MNYAEAKATFIGAWGTLGSSWGINKTMAHIHALLLLSVRPLSTEEIMAELHISRGNANMNLRALMDWGIVHKEHKLGDRKEYFFAGKDIAELARQIARERKKRELEPLIRVLQQFNALEDDSSPAIRELKRVTADLDEFAAQAEAMLNLFIRSQHNWLYKTLGNLIR
jgi:DNA-binding transcriptional regulator GbsR (MarR family)